LSNADILLFSRFGRTVWQGDGKNRRPSLIPHDRGPMDAQRSLTEADYRELAPFSKRLLAATVNGRSAAGKFVSAYRKELLAHLGRPPSTVEMRIVERAALLAAHPMMLDRKAFKEGGLSPRTMREYLALNNSLVRTAGAAQVGR
jgi:hypothetical protein